MADPKITREDLEAKFRALQGDVKSSVESKKKSIASIAAGAGLLALIIVFLLGKRSGKKKTTMVEIRRL